MFLKVIRKYLFLIVIVILFNSDHPAMADEVKEKTDGSFVGEDTEIPINSSFVGDISNSMVNGSWGQEDLPKKTDDAFVGIDSLEEENSSFVGDNFDREVHEQTDAPFAQDHPN